MQGTVPRLAFLSGEQHTGTWYSIIPVHHKDKSTALFANNAAESSRAPTRPPADARPAGDDGVFIGQPILI